MIPPGPDVPDVLQIHSVSRHPRELRGGWAVIPLPRQFVHEIQSQARHRHLELLPGRRGGRVDAALGQLGHEIGIRLIGDRKSTRLNSSHPSISYAVFCLKKKKKKHNYTEPLTTTNRQT